MMTFRCEIRVERADVAWRGLPVSEPSRLRPSTSICPQRCSAPWRSRRRRSEERRGKVIDAEGEFQASERLREASDVMAQFSPYTLQLRYLQTLSEISRLSTLRHRTVLSDSVPFSVAHAPAGGAAAPSVNGPAAAERLRCEKRRKTEAPGPRGPYGFAAAARCKIGRLRLRGGRVPTRSIDLLKINAHLARRRSGFLFIPASSGARDFS